MRYLPRARRPRCWSIPLAHISGGDVTAGAADDWFRHCLTKMASLHFPSCEVYARRLIRMGEDPAAVENVGGLGDENLRSLPLLSRAALAESIGFGLERPYAAGDLPPRKQRAARPRRRSSTHCCAALERCGLAAVFTKANADAGGADINARIDAVCAARPGQLCRLYQHGRAAVPFGHEDTAPWWRATRPPA